MKLTGGVCVAFLSIVAAPGCAEHPVVPPNYVAVNGNWVPTTATCEDPPCDPPPAIRVVQATYGANCGIGRGNVTGHLAGACNGRLDCAYSVYWQVIGDPAFGCAKTYEAEYTCSNDPAPRAVFAYPEAGFGSQVFLSCR
jgi:hypothetical protein